MFHQKSNSISRTSKLKFQSYHYSQHKERKLQQIVNFQSNQRKKHLRSLKKSLTNQNSSYKNNQWRIKRTTSLKKKSIKSINIYLSSYQQKNNKQKRDQTRKQNSQSIQQNINSLEKRHQRRKTNFQKNSTTNSYQRLFSLQKHYKFINRLQNQEKHLISQQQEITIAKKNRKKIKYFDIKQRFKKVLFQKRAILVIN